jgi:hypothetical protein
VRHARTQAQATRDALIEALRAYHQAALADVPPVHAEEMLERLPANLYREVTR